MGAPDDDDTKKPPPPVRVCVDRCVCFQRPFVELLSIARARSLTTLEELQDETAFGLSCRICNPYVRRMLRTGETTFHELLDDDGNVIPLDGTRRR